VRKKMPANYFGRNSPYLRPGVPNTNYVRRYVSYAGLDTRNRNRARTGDVENARRRRRALNPTSSPMLRDLLAGRDYRQQVSAPEQISRALRMHGTNPRFALEAARRGYVTRNYRPGLGTMLRYAQAPLIREEAMRRLNTPRLRSAFNTFRRHVRERRERTRRTENREAWGNIFKKQKK